MGMTGEEIKIECEEMYAQIKSAEERLQELRSICKHEYTFVGTYSYRVGSYSEAEICSHCGALIKYI